MSNIASEDGGPAVPPPAPPLPPQPSSARAAANAIARFAQNINYGARASTTAQNHLRDSAAPGLTLKRSSSPVSSRSTSHKTGIPIASLDISPCRTRAILAGRDILKTLAVTGSTCSEDYNLREKIIRYAATHEPAAGRVSAKHKDQLAANDVKWSHGDFHTTIAAAAANGQIVVYDLNRAGVELVRLHEHNRQVHRLGFNPHRGNLLLSGSQDATTRLWDLRALAGERSVMTCQSKSRYAGNSEGVRDLRWSPTNGVEFAVGTDSGVLQRWDIRKESAPNLKINAHEKTCNSVDWHPDGKHLVSGSADKRVKVWDFSSSDRRMKPMWELRVPQAAMNVRWRPACWSSEDNRPGSWHCTQLAVSYDKEDPRIHIWDLRRPSVPFRVLDRYETPPTVLLWHSEDLLWSVGSAGMFTQTDVRFAPKTMDHYNVNPISIAPDGRILFASMKRERRRLSIEDVTDNLLSIERREPSKSGRNSAVHSGTPGSHEEPSLLSSTFKNRRSRAPNSLKSARSMDITPPSAGPDDAVLPLEQSMQEKYMYKSPQVLGIGYVTGLVDAQAFKFMARHYIPPPELPPSNQRLNLHLVFNETFRHNARVAAFAGKHRLAQTWRILGLAVEKELGKRAEHNYHLRKAVAASQKAREQSSTQLSDPNPKDIARNNENAAPDATKAVSKTAVATVSQAHSDLSTPLARPARAPLTGFESIDKIEPLDQHPSLHSPSSTKGQQADRTAAQITANTGSSNRTESAKESYHFRVEDASASSEDYGHSEPKPQSPSSGPSADTGFVEMDRQMAERRAAMGNYRAQPRPVLKLDDPFQGLESGPNILKLNSEDSNEGFQMFSASTDSSHKVRSTMGSFESNRAPERLGHMAEEQGRGGYDEEKFRISDNSHAKGQAENAMAFDDEAEMVAGQRSPASPENSTSTQKEKGKGKAPEVTDRRSMPSLESAELEPPIVNFEDMHPFSKIEPPPEDDEPPTGDYQYIHDDFCVTQPDENDPAPYFPPWTATAMFLPLVNYHCESLFDAQFPSYLLFHLAPYLYVPMHPFRARQIVTTYHEHLLRFELYVQATELRMYCEEFYPEIAAWSGEGLDTGGPWCTNCKKLSKGSQYRYCERCEKPWAHCPICHGHGALSPNRPMETDTIDSPRATNPKAGDSLWGWCPRCGHGGHIGCLRAFWDFSEEGACPTVGCTCDCMPGKTRDEIHERLEEEWKKKPGTVTKDNWSVKESGAVQRTRSMVGAAEVGRSILQGGRGAGRGQASRGVQTLGAAGRSASGGKKSVRIVVPDDDEEEEERGKEKGRDGKTGSFSAF